MPQPENEPPVPPRVMREVERILDAAAKRFFEEHLAHVRTGVAKQATCPVCRQKQLT